MGNIINCSTDYCFMDYYPDDNFRKSYGDEAADNYVIWNFRQRLGDNVNILSIAVAFITSWEIPNIMPKKVMYICTYCKNYEKD